MLLQLFEASAAKEPPSPPFISPVALHLNRRLWPFTALNSWTDDKGHYHESVPGMVISRTAHAAIWEAGQAGVWHWTSAPPFILFLRNSSFDRFCNRPEAWLHGTNHKEPVPWRETFRGPVDNFPIPQISSAPKGNCSCPDSAEW